MECIECCVLHARRDGSCSLLVRSYVLDISPVNVCVCVCVCVCACVSASVRVRACVRAYLHACMRLFACVCVHVYVCTHTLVCMYVCPSVCLSACVSTPAWCKQGPSLTRVLCLLLLEVRVGDHLTTGCVDKDTEGRGLISPPLLPELLWQTTSPWLCGCVLLP